MYPRPAQRDLPGHDRLLPGLLPVGPGMEDPVDLLPDQFLRDTAEHVKIRLGLRKLLCPPLDRGPEEGAFFL